MHLIKKDVISLLWLLSSSNELYLVITNCFIDVKYTGFYQ